MGEQDYVFEGVERVDAVLHQERWRLAYLVVYDRTERQRDVRVARLTPGVWDTDAMIAAWVRTVAEAHTGSRPWRRFRVRLYGARGKTTVGNAAFVCARRPPRPVTMRELGEAYARWGRLFLGSLQVQEALYAEVEQRMRREVEAARAEVVWLAGLLAEAGAAACNEGWRVARSEQVDPVRWTGMQPRPSATRRRGTGPGRPAPESRACCSRRLL